MPSEMYEFRESTSKMFGGGARPAARARGIMSDPLVRKQNTSPNVPHGAYSPWAVTKHNNNSYGHTNNNSHVTGHAHLALPWRHQHGDISPNIRVTSSCGVSPVNRGKPSASREYVTADGDAADYVHGPHRGRRDGKQKREYVHERFGKSLLLLEELANEDLTIKRNVRTTDNGSWSPPRAVPENKVPDATNTEQNGGHGYGTKEVVKNLERLCEDIPSRLAILQESDIKPALSLFSRIQNYIRKHGGDSGQGSTMTMRGGRLGNGASGGIKRKSAVDSPRPNKEQ